MRGLRCVAFHLVLVYLVISSTGTSGNGVPAFRVRPRVASGRSYGQVTPRLLWTGR